MRKRRISSEGVLVLGLPRREGAYQSRTSPAPREAVLNGLERRAEPAA
jgi:hypothetical protein